MDTVSIITAALDAVSSIGSAIQSVRSQTYPSIEHVIIDGGSTDGTTGVIEGYSDSIAYFVSEPDSGIYNAMNKGIKAATGDILLFLNSDDRLCDEEVVEDVVSAFREKPDVEIVYGNLLWNVSGKMVRRRQPSTITRGFLGRTTILHQTVFAKEAIFEETNGFSEHYRIVSDYEWMLKVFLRDKRKYLHLDRDVAVMGTSGASWTSTDWETERIAVMKQYFSGYEILRYRMLPVRIRAAYKAAMGPWRRD